MSTVLRGEASSENCRAHLLVSTNNEEEDHNRDIGPRKPSREDKTRESEEGVSEFSASAASMLAGSGYDGPKGAVANVQYEPYEDMSYIALGRGSGASKSLSSSAALSRPQGLPLLPHEPSSYASSKGARSSSSLTGSSLPTSNSAHPITSTSFPAKLHRILRDPECTNHISWLPHGRAWKVRNQAEFESKCLPRYFRHGRFASFLRQVNGWGFKRVLSGTDEHAYYHEYFLRGLPDVAERMRRVNTNRPPNSPGQGRQRGSQRLSSSTSAGGGHRQAIFIPPDFYHISKLHPLPNADGSWPKGSKQPRDRQARQAEDPQKVPSSSPAALLPSQPSVAAVAGQGYRALSDSAVGLTAERQPQQPALLPSLQAAVLRTAPQPGPQTADAAAVALAQSSHGLPLVLPSGGQSCNVTQAQGTVGPIPALAAINLPVAAATTARDPRVLLLQNQILQANQATTVAPTSLAVLLPQNRSATSVLQLQALKGYGAAPVLSPFVDAATARPGYQTNADVVLSALLSRAAAGVTPTSIQVQQQGTPAIPIISAQPEQQPAMANMVQPLVPPAPQQPRAIVRQASPQILPQVLPPALLPQMPPRLQP